VTLEWTDYSDAASTGYRVDLDAVKVWGSLQ
jgi:hypothetical protein